MQDGLVQFIRLQTIPLEWESGVSGASQKEPPQIFVLMIFIGA